jgi:ribosomal protein L37E
MLEERVAPHAYAAAGEMAPEVVEDNSGKAMVRCRRCGTMSQIDADACASCGIPFTIEAGTVEPAWSVDGWAVASVVLGAISLATPYVPGLAAIAVVAGLVALRRLHVQYGGLQRVAAWSGMALAGLSTAMYVAHVIRHD